MSFIVRRVLLTLLVPFAWKKWRNRNRSGDGPGADTARRRR